MNRGESAGLYLHVPFCRKKCPYCGFYSTASSSLIPRWIEALKREAALYEGRFEPFDTLYVGGGTPTLLERKDLKEIVDCLRRGFPFSSDVEFTVEANPEDITPQKLECLVDLGVNRISLGVQSFSDDALLYLKRRHSARQAEEAVRMIRTSGFGNVSIDLMYGFEAQGLAGWRDTLRRAVDLAPEHISCYQLTYEEETSFGKLLARGKMNPLSESRESSFFLGTTRFLQKHGYLQYEVSNFSRAAEYASRHNLKYWRRVPYLGLGPSAHSFDGYSRWWNIRSVELYCGMLSKEGAPVDGIETLNGEQEYLERLMLGLRTREGISAETIADRHNYDRVLRDLTKSGIIRVADGRILPTQKGLMVADSLPLMFCP